MERRVLLLFCGLFVSDSVGQTSNPECEDLVTLKKHAERSFKLLGKLSCTPNKNCSGLSCNGSFSYLNIKPFRGTVVLQGCHKPVSLLIHWGNRHLLVKDGQKIHINSYMYVVPKIKKEGNIVHVDLTLYNCIISKRCIHTKILDDQTIRVHCNDSNPATSDLPWSNSTHSPLHTQLPKTKYHIATHTDSTHTRPMLPANNKRPMTKLNTQRSTKCKSLKSAEDSIEHNFRISKLLFPGSKVNCTPVSNCSGLHCSGVVNKQNFTTLMTINYCSSPTTLRLHIDVPSKRINIDHVFKNGESYEVSKTYPVYVTVHLKKLKNFVNVSITIKILSISHDLVKNMSFAVDPSHCHGRQYVYNSWTTKQFITGGRNSNDKSLSKGAIAGIVIASLVLFVLLGMCGIWLMKNKRLSPRPAYYNNLMMSDDTDPLYDDSEPAMA